MRPENPNDRTAPTRRSVLARRVVLFSLCLCGCKGIGKPDSRYDLLEAELRTRERELQEARAERDQLRLLTSAQNSMNCPPAPPVYRPDSGVPTLSLKEVLLGTGTGGVDNDGRPGDEALQVVIVPKDDDGTAVKVPGQATVQAFEVSPEGLKTCIGQWNVAPEQLKRTWKSGLLSPGYFVPLQWDQAPRVNRLRLVVRFRSLDGKEFEADKDVSVRPMLNSSGLPTGIVPVIPPPGVPETLPPPPGLAEPAARMRLPG